MKELMSPPACKGHGGVGAPTVLSQQPAHTQPRGLATRLCHSYTEHATTSRATLLPCGPRCTPLPWHPGTETFVKSGYQAWTSTTMCVPGRAHSQARQGLGQMRFPRASLPVPLRAGLALTVSQTEKLLLTHLLEQPCPQGFPSDLLFTLAEASSQGSHSPLPALPSALRSPRTSTHSVHPLGAHSPPLETGVTQLPAKPKWQGKREVPQL